LCPGYYVCKQELAQKANPLANADVIRVTVKITIEKNKAPNACKRDSAEHKRVAKSMCAGWKGSGPSEQAAQHVTSHKMILSTSTWSVMGEKVVDI
jgi:hypothetical protein